MRPLSSSTTCISCGPSPGVTPDHIEVYGFIRSPVLERGSSCRKTSRSCQVGTSFSMPTTLMSTSGRVRHIRPLPSLSTTTRVPVSATAKLAPEMATLARRNFSRRCSRAAAARSFGSSVSPSGAGRPAAAIRVRKISRTSERLRWIAGTRMWLGRSSPSWTISSARSVSHAAMPSRGERLVEVDLLGGHGLDLDHLVHAVALGDARDDGAGLLGVAGPVDGHPAGLQRGLELEQVLVQVGAGCGP